jgi:hypothetical protein
LDDKQVQKIAEKAQLGTFEPHVKVFFALVIYLGNPHVLP